jgi:hypothetical protein
MQMTEVDGKVPSSEGFTAFFTTTHSSESASDGKQQHQVVDVSAVRSGGRAAPNDQPAQDESDANSMAVLARVKRKHRNRQRQDEGSSRSNDIITESSDSQVAAQEEQQATEAAQPDSSSVSSEAPHRQQQDRAMEVAAIRLDQEDPRHQPRIVSESNAATNTSGSGSGGNSGGNPGSSGSGNENQGSSGSGGESKDVVDAMYVNNGEAQISLGDDHNPAVDINKARSESPNIHGLEGTSEADRERKLLDKKRKRMDMRRAYEAELRSDSSSSAEEVAIQPGRPVTLESVLSFTKVAR